MRAKNLKKKLGFISDEALAQRIQISPKTFYNAVGTQKITDKTWGKLAAAERAAGVGEDEKTPWDKDTLKINLRTVKVFGTAEALGARFHMGDLMPDSEDELEEIQIPDEGKHYVGFRVSGDSMAPRISAGDIALADPKAEVYDRNIVLIKWNGTVCIKRYFKKGDTLWLRSDNPAAGEDFKISTRDVQWCMRVVKLHVEL